MIAASTIEEIRMRTQIKDVVGDFVKLKKSGADFEGLCPFHNEKSPSFKVHPGKGIFKCFGCGASGDAIAFIMKIECKTYVEALHYLANRYHISLDEIVVNRKTYVKPVARLQKVSDSVLTYFEQRGICNNTLLRLHVTEAAEWMPKAQKVVPAICFEYYRDEELVNIKFRAKGKDFKLSKDAELIFWNLNAIKDTTECVIVEGEIDGLTLHESGVYNVVSVPNGAGVGNINLEYLDNCWQWFADKTKIILMTDNDEPGIRLRDELARRLGFERCYRVQYPDGYKDANEVLVGNTAKSLPALGKAAIKEIVNKATEWPLQGVLSVTDMMDDVIHFYENGFPNGFKIPIPGFKEKLQLMLGQFTTVTGIPGSGKSEIVDLIMVAMATFYGWNWAVFSAENQPASLHVTKLMEKFAGKSFSFRNNSEDRIKKQELGFCMEFVDDFFHFINIDEVDVTLLSILEKVKELVLRKGVKGVVIDPWNRLEHKAQQGQTETQYVNWALTQISAFCKRHGVHLILIAHPTKLKKDPKTNKYEIPSMYSISGSAHFFNQTDNGISIYRDFSNNIVDIYRQKVRFYWLGEMGHSSYSFDKIRRQYNYLDSAEPMPDFMKVRKGQLTGSPIQMQFTEKDDIINGTSYQSDDFDDGFDEKPIS